MRLFGRKKKVRADRTEKQILISEMKELTAFLEEKVKAWTVERERFLREAEKAKKLQNKDLADLNTGYANDRAAAIEWARKSIDGLIKCIDEYSIVLPARAGSNADIYHGRVKKTVEELTTLKAADNMLVSEKIYPLVERLALEIADCAKI